MHRVKRQIVEIKVPRAELGEVVYEEFSRLQRYIEPIIEKCCDAVADDNQVTRIQSLELDLGE